MKKELTKQERYELAARLFKLLGADIDADEEQTIRDAVAVISPEYAADMDAQEDAAVEFFENYEAAALAELDAIVPPEQEGKN